MDAVELAERLEQAGAATVAVEATIRLRVDDATLSAATDDTVLASSASGSLPQIEGRRLPRITVDLRDTVAPPAADATADLEVLELLGEGGMGRVFVARQHSLARDVAVKTAKDGAPDVARHAIVREGVVTGQLEHPAIVPVHALGIDQSGRPAMVMKRIEGVTWDELLTDPDHPIWESWEGDGEGRLDGHLQILVQVCNAVHFAHSRRIVHRDLKPENVLIGRFGDVYVADWGVALHLDEDVSHQLCGTPGFMAPEMVRGEAVDERTDVYLLGAILHQLLTGQLRHDAPSTLGALALAIASKPHDYGVEVPPELAALANRACHASPSERPASVTAFRDAIAAHRRHRVSERLREEGSERLARLRELHERRDVDAETRRQIDKLVTEARFGLEQALREWPDNAAASKAMAELENILDERRERTRALEVLAHQRDPTVGEGARIWVFLAFMVTGVLLGVSLNWIRESTVGLVFAFGVILSTITVTLMAAFRRHLFVNEFSKQMTLLVAAAVALIMVDRTIGLIFRAEVHEVLLRDFLILASAATIGTIVLVRWVMPLALIYVAGAVLIAAFPTWSLSLFGGLNVVAMLLGVALAWRHQGRGDSS